MPVYRSPSSRRAWIEIGMLRCVSTSSPVALLAEGVDRNINEAVNRYLAEVALLAEGVDRNYAGMMENHGTGRSPSSRRAWIEISNVVIFTPHLIVALLAEGVDRNMVFVLLFCGGVVALLAEGVDRNWFERA